MCFLSENKDTFRFDPKKWGPLTFLEKIGGDVRVLVVLLTDYYALGNMIYELSMSMIHMHAHLTANDFHLYRLYNTPLVVILTTLLAH